MNYVIIVFTVQIVQHCKPKLELPINSDLLHNLNGGQNANLTNLQLRVLHRIGGVFWWNVTKYVILLQ